MVALRMFMSSRLRRGGTIFGLRPEAPRRQIDNCFRTGLVEIFRNLLTVAKERDGQSTFTGSPDWTKGQVSSNG